MIKITVEGPDSHDVCLGLKNYFQLGQRKVVRHYDKNIENIPPCDVALIEIKEKKGDQ